MIKVILESDELLTIGEAVKALGVSRATVYRWLKAGKLPSQKAGKVLIPRSGIEKILKEDDNDLVESEAPTLSAMPPL